MKQYILKREGTTANLEQVPTEKIPIFASEDKLNESLDNLKIGQIVATADATESDTIAVLMAKIDALEPIGMVQAFAGAIPNSNWLECDGSTFDETKYPALYTYLSTNTLPDYRECVLVGAGTNSTLSIADHDVYEVGEFKDDQLQSHTHSATGDGNLGAPGSYQYLNGGTRATSANSGRSGTTTHGKQVGVCYCIKAK